MNQAQLDQARAASMHGNSFRVIAASAGRFLDVVEGPLADAAIRWATMPAREYLGCAHLPRTAKPQPLYGLLPDVGRMYCLGCAPAAISALPPVCCGCGTDLPDDYQAHLDVVIGLDHYLTLLGFACAPCRSLCDPKPQPTKEM